MKRRHWFNVGPVPQQPVAPAFAYGVVAQLLPKSFFDQRSPSSGYRFEVVGHDNRPTEWYVPAHLATQLEQLLRASRSIKSVRVVPYEDKK